MEPGKRIAAFSQLGDRLAGLAGDDVIARIGETNGWFTRSEVRRALGAWADLLKMDKLQQWAQAYNLDERKRPSDILVITAGNLPLVGFHDFLSVLVSGNRFIGRLSSRDNILIPLIARELIRIEPGFSGFIHFGEKADPDAVIATGSDNSSRYFRTAFGHLPSIIRKNRSSAAILDGSETNGELDGLVADMLVYYGLGCRSITHVYLPEQLKTDDLADRIRHYAGTDPCPLYRDNLRYQKARLALLGIRVTDARNALLTENESLHSAIGVIHYSYYSSLDRLKELLDYYDSGIQCLAGHGSLLPGLVPFGKTQNPELGDYADRLDTLAFLTNLP
jgi:hypothetical protein